MTTVNDSKNTMDRVEQVEQADCQMAETMDLSQEHRDYLIARWGTIDLDPIPDMSDADPYNWSKSTKVINLILVAFHAMMSSFNAAAISSAYELIAVDLNVSLQKATYLTSLQIAFLGYAPLLWRPLANRYGRRPIFLISLVCACVGNIGCAVSPTYSTQALCRAIVAFFISPASAIGSAVVAETFFRKERARYMGLWVIMFNLGIPLAPFIFGFVSVRVGYRWIYWTLAIINAVQTVLYFFFGPETRYIASQGHQPPRTSYLKGLMTFGRIDSTPFTLSDFYEPLKLIFRPDVFLPAFALSVANMLGSIIINVEIPQLFAEKFDFNAQQLGYQFSGMIIGNVIGEQISGRLSDAWMSHAERRQGRKPAPEFRLWLLHIGLWSTIAGVVVFFVRIEQALPLHYNVTPVVGSAISVAGVQIITTTAVTYAVDCYRHEAGSIGVVVNTIRQTVGFTGPFWFVAMFNNAGLYGSAGIVAGLLLLFSGVPVFVVQAFGRKMRHASKAVSDADKS